MMNALFACALLITGMVVVVVTGEEFNCENYDPNSGVCTADAIMYCLTNGTIIIGRCHARRAVCQDKQSVDATMAACAGKGDHARFDCDKYKENPSVCTRDLIPFCLTNGTVLHGTCAATRAVCMENQHVEEDFGACNTRGTRGSSATTTSAGLLPSLGLLLTTLI